MRNILHCDLNNFFASVEELNNNELKNVPMAVCGDPNKRHGIILAKNNIAKRFGIYTPELVSSAKAKCPNLVLVEPHYNEYLKYSRLVNEVYLKYTDRVEPFSIDESYLDVTESEKLFGKAEDIAYKIKEEIKEKYGLTISVGVSFCKSLAKLGSDMKKPDAITVLDFENYKKKIYSLPVSSLMFAGSSTCEALSKIRIKTIGDLAYTDKNDLIRKVGKLGGILHDVANGKEFSEVKHYTDLYVPKSISKGATLREDISGIETLRSLAITLTNEVVSKLRYQNLMATCININFKNSEFITSTKQKKISKSDSYEFILSEILNLLEETYDNKSLIRTLTVGVSSLVEKSQEQLDIFSAFNEHKRQNEALKVVDMLKDEEKGIKIDLAKNIK